MMKRFSLFIAILCCAGMLSAAQFDGLKSITTGGKTRQYYLYVPNALKPNSPMIISCHGMNQDYNYQKEQTQWPSLADTASFVVVYPVGIAGSAWGTSYSTGWDIEGMTDVNFMLDIIDAVKADYDIDKTRVYLSGFSLGAVFVYHAINKAADKFAAYAPISGYNLMTNNTSASRPVPIIHVHGDADNTMPYSGIKDYIKKWAQAQNCNMTPIESLNNGTYCTRYTDGDCETEVVLYTVYGRGHFPTNTGFHTSNAIWAFCKQYDTGCGKIANASVSLSVTGGMHAPAKVTLTATPILSGDVTVSSIEFYQDNELIKTVMTEPYEVTVENLAKGTYKFTAFMTDSRGKFCGDTKTWEVDDAKCSEERFFWLNDIIRFYYLYVPGSFKSGNPMIISCHDINQNHNVQREQTQWCAMADTAGFAVAFPLGINGSTWGVPYDTGWDCEGTKDVDFMVAIIDDAAKYFPIDKTRVYLTGFGVGAAFVYNAINHAADKFAAFAPVSGYNPFNADYPNTTASSRPVPIIHVHGDADYTMSYVGIEGYIKAWAQAEKCNMTPIETSEDGYTCTRYTDGDCETEVVLYSVTGRGHEQTDEGFPTCDAIWQFCRQYNTGCGKISPEGIESPSLQGRSGEASKFIKDGQLFILHGDKLFNAIGTQVK